MTFGMEPTFHRIVPAGNARWETFTVRLPPGHLPDVALFGRRVR
jgi:hypothetical protein